MGKIELINNEWLDVDEVENFPITRKRGDLNNLSSRSGDFSKTLTLPGTKNNHKVLGQLFDVNTKEGSFDVNKKVPCFVEKNGVEIWGNCYFQLKQVIKSKKSHSTEPDSYKYEALIFNELRDLFKDLDNLNVNELQINDSTTTHILNFDNITAGFIHDTDNKYAYHASYLPKIDEQGNNLNQNIYRAENFKPSIFAKTILDTIFQELGKVYVWDSLANDDIRFDKLVHPFLGEVELSDQDRIEQGADIGTPTVQEVEDSPIIESLAVITYEKTSGEFWNPQGQESEPQMGLLPSAEPSDYIRILDNVNLDLRDQYDATTGVFTPEITSSYEVLITFDYEIDFVADANCELVVTNADSLIYNFTPFINGIPSARHLINSLTGATKTFVEGDILTTGSNIFTGSSEGSIPLSSNFSSIKTVGFNLKPVVEAFNIPASALWLDGSDDFVGVQPKLTITSINIKFKSFDEYQEGFLININKFLPNIKQSDYLRSIFTMFNIIPEEDKADPNKIIFKTRDEYYKSGKQWDFSQRLDRSRDLNIRFLPEVNSKAVELTYDIDKDPYHEGYNTAVGKIFGRMRYIFDSEFTKGVDQKKISFASTPIASLASWGGYAPAITSKSEKTRILYLQTPSTVHDLIFEKANGDVEVIEAIPFAHHWDDPNNPSFDLNFGVCDYYFYPDYKHTSNNLFNLHYRSTFNQINTGKMAIAWFMLDELIISQIELNDSIYFNNSWWNINKFEYDASNKTNLVKIELISVADDFTVQAERGNETGVPVYGDFVDGFVQPLPSDPEIVYPDIEVSNDYIERTNTFGGNNAGVFVTGIRNILNRFANLVTVIGSGNYVNTSNALVVGNDMIVNESGIHTDKLFVAGKQMLPNDRTIYRGENADIVVDANDFDFLVWSSDFTANREVSIDNFTPDKELKIIINNNNGNNIDFIVKFRNGTTGAYSVALFVNNGGNFLALVNINGDTQGARWLVMNSFDNTNTGATDFVLGKFN